MSYDDRLWDDSLGNDDLEAAMAWQPVPPVSEEDLEDEPKQPADYFFEEANISPGMSVGPRQSGYTSVCRYDQLGRHIRGTRNCPHNQDFDETGRIMPEGWTVQSWR
jgi:hypothetical protein